MSHSPVLSILGCLSLSAEERGRLLAETEVPSQVAAVFFKVASGSDIRYEVAGMLDALADFGECVRVVPDSKTWGAGAVETRDFFLIAIVPTEGLSDLEMLFSRPSVERFSYATWEDRIELGRFFQEIRRSSAPPVQTGPEDLLNQARTFILKSETSPPPESASEPLPAAVIEECRSIVTRPAGFRAAGVRCGLKSKRMDLGILVSDRPATVALRSTRNRFCSPPVMLSHEHLQKRDVRAVVVNSGNANAATGDRGMEDARRMASLTAELLDLETHQVLVCSTGIIGRFLPMEKVERGIRDAVAQLDVGHDDRLIQAIMTTDTVPKSALRELNVGGKTIAIGGIAKGSGMIHPDMATMQAYLTTDAAVEYSALHLALGAAVDESFNCLTVDGDTSTSDSVILFANGAAGNDPLTSNQLEFADFLTALKEVCVELVRQLARDGEGATHLVRVVCEGAESYGDAFEVAQKVATSLLVKTAIFGRDPNWGRIVMAIGNTSARFAPHKVRVWMAGQLLFAEGLAVEFDREQAVRDLAQEEVELRIDLGKGNADPVTVYTCDISYDYVRINAEYHT